MTISTIDFFQIIGKCNKFLFIEKDLKNIVEKYHLELIYKNLIFSVFPEKVLCNVSFLIASISSTILIFKSSKSHMLFL